MKLQSVEHTNSKYVDSHLVGNHLNPRKESNSHYKRSPSNLGAEKRGGALRASTSSAEYGEYIKNDPYAGSGGKSDSSQHQRVHSLGLQRKQAQALLASQSS